MKSELSLTKIRKLPIQCSSDRGKVEDPRNSYEFLEMSLRDCIRQTTHPGDGGRDGRNGTLAEILRDINPNRTPGANVNALPGR